MYQTHRPAIASLPLLAAVLAAALSLAAAAPAACAQGRIEVELAAGQPFGVGRITFELPPDMLPAPLGLEGVRLAEKNGRTLYPALDNPAIGKLVKGVLESDTPLTTGGPVRRQVGGLLREMLDRPPRATIYFLFRGDEPLEMTLDARGPIPLGVVPPKANPTAHRRLLDLWWRQYAKPATLLQPKPDFPPLVETFLTATLARRLNLRLPEEKQTPSAYATLDHELGLNLGTESLRLAMLQDRALGLGNLAQPADQPMPPPLDAPPLDLPDVANNVPTEAIADRVPVECFYVRFGSFANFLWLQDTLAQWGGDAQNLIALRGLDRGMSRRMETQLVIKQTALSRMLGDTVIADVAIIGTDMFFREGASYGLLFHARNNFALATSIGQQRQERIAKGGVKEEKVDIAGHAVPFLSSPDGSVRSYYVSDGDFHFIATSKTLAERFLATASGESSLGHSKEFRHARTVMPLSRNDTIFLYVSDAFFRNFTAPRHRIEMARRLQAAADIDLMQLARLAAVAEGRPGATIDELASSGLLPPDFGPLPDGSRVELDGGKVYDSLRGRRGAFVPVADAPPTKITQAELSDYNKFAEFYRTQWGRMDPILAGIKRTELEDNREQVVVDVLMSPFAPQHVAAFKQQLGPADAQRLAPIPGNLATLELVLTRQRVFAGLRDLGRPAAPEALPAPTPAPSANPWPNAPPSPNAAPSPNTPPSPWRGTNRLRDFLVGYIGATGELGVLGVLDFGIPRQSDPAGYAGSPLGGWRWQSNPFTVFSFQREVLETITPQLRFEQADRPAQIRLHVEDPSGARITPRLNDLAYARTRETSLGNLRLLHALDQQLHIPPKDCRETAESLLDAKMICPLGGQYVLRDAKGPPTRWTSTVLENSLPAAGGLFQTHAPPGYQAPPLSWFRGLDLDAAMTPTTVSAHAEVIMQLPAKK